MPFGNSTSTLGALLDADVPITFTQESKMPGTTSAARYDRYRHASTLRQAIDLGAWTGDLYNDIRKGIITPADACVRAHLSNHLWDTATAEAWAQMAFPFHTIGTDVLDHELLADAALRAHPSPTLAQAINTSTGREAFPPWLHARRSAAAAPVPEPEPEPEDEPDFAPGAAFHAIPSSVPGALALSIPEAWPLLINAAQTPSTDSSTHSSREPPRVS